LISFKESIETPEIWFHQAWEMYEASRAIYDSFLSISGVTSDKERYRKLGLMKSAMLMLGLAAENSLKGAFVYKSKPDLSKNKLNSKFFPNFAHDLTGIADELNLNLSNEEKALLKRLSMFVIWASKYKAPMNKSDHQNSKNNIIMQYPSDFDKIESLIKSLQLRSGYSEEFGWPYES
jgi:hypothetical protein